jgi:hypothetical protein
MLSAKGTNGTIHFDGQTITIERTGLSARMLVGGGEKRIPVASVTAVQWRKAGLTTGFIQFTLAGGIERRSKPGHTGSDAKHDENTVTFHARAAAHFEPIREAIDEAIAAAARAADRGARRQGARSPTSWPSSPRSAIRASSAPSDFEAGKARILGG